jgi:hypothetical protein
MDLTPEQMEKLKEAFARAAARKEQDKLDRAWKDVLDHLRAPVVMPSNRELQIIKEKLDLGKPTGCYAQVIGIEMSTYELLHEGDSMPIPNSQWTVVITDMSETLMWGRIYCTNLTDIVCHFTPTA